MLVIYVVLDRQPSFLHNFVCFSRGTVTVNDLFVFVMYPLTMQIDVTCMCTRRAIKQFYVLAAAGQSPVED